MLTIRLIKTGKRNNSNFRVILIEKSAAPKSGKFLEILGYYNPHNKEINLKEERIKYWLSKGAKASETVHNLLVRKEVIKGPKIKRNIRGKKKTAQDESDVTKNKDKVKEPEKEEKEEKKTDSEEK